MPVIPFEVDTIGDCGPQSHSNTFATVDQNKLQKEKQVEQIVYLKSGLAST